MVLKGAFARKLKEGRVEERSSRSLYVSFRNKNGLDRSKIVEIFEKVHSDIERVFLPRQKSPRSVYILCKGDDEREGVRQALRKMKSDDIDAIFPRLSKPQKPVVTKKKKTKVMGCKPVMNPRTLLLNWVPTDLSTEELHNAFPEAERVDRFNPRRCYVYFNTVEEAMKAKVRISKEKIGGHHINATFNKSNNTEEEGT